MIGPLVALAAACLAVVPPLVLPASAMSDIGVTVGPDQPSAWAEWNYSGYQRKPDYPEYHAVIQMMAKVGRTEGCGRAMWEYDPSENRFGTTMSLMLLPYWTDGCVDSMEGLLFESSATTPFHFINQNELSVNPSDAVDSNAFQYEGLNVPLGIRHLQLLGVRYFLAASPTVEAAAARDPNLTQLASSGPWNTSYNGQSLDTTWKVYEIKHSALVTPLQNRPVVWTGVSPGPDQLARSGGHLVRHPRQLEGGPCGRRSLELDPGAGHRYQLQGGARTCDHRLRCGPDRQLDLVPCRSDGDPGRGQGLLLPELAGRGCARSVAGGTEPDGGGADQSPGDPHLWQHDRRPGGRSDHPGGGAGGLRAGRRRLAGKTISQEGAGHDSSTGRVRRERPG